MLTEDITDFIALVEGYFRIQVDPNKTLLQPEGTCNNNTDAEVPPYHGKHRVLASPWSYPEDQVSEFIDANNSEESKKVCDNEKTVDLSEGPPDYPSEEASTAVEQPAKVTDTIKAEKDKATDTLKLGGLGEVEIHAPLASPDKSTISESSDSNSDNAEKLDSSRQSLQHEDLEAALLSKTSSDSSEMDLLRDSDSGTNSSLSTIISRTTLNGAFPGIDTRMGVQTLKTFSSEPNIKNIDDKPLTHSISQDNAAFSDSSLDICDLDSKAENGIMGDSHADDSMSDADSESTISGGVDLEKKPLIQPKESSSYREDDAPEGPSYVQSESDDTDSVSTPTDSPSKKRLESLDVSPPSLFRSESDRPQSFGLHSPDQLPKTESEFRAIASSFGLHSPDTLPSELLHPSYNPRLFCDGGLYLDPDIIDLTLIPPPKTPDEDRAIDFSSPMSTPPPGFTDNTEMQTAEEALHHMAVDSMDYLPSGIEDLPIGIKEQIDQLILNDEELGTQLAVIDALMLEDALKQKDVEKESGIESESDSGNETISSENIDFGSSSVHDFPGHLDSSGQFTKDQWADKFSEPSEGATGGSHVQSSSFGAWPMRGQHQLEGGEEDFNTKNIDEIIAAYTVPPPPKDSPEEIRIPSPPPAEEPVLNKPSMSFEENLSPLTKKILNMDTALVGACPEIDLDSLDQSVFEEFKSLIVPPPPSCSEVELGEIPIVPPVDEQHLMSPLSESESPNAETDSMMLKTVTKSSEDQSKTLIKDKEKESGSDSSGGSPHKVKPSLLPKTFKLKPGVCGKEGGKCGGGKDLCFSESKAVPSRVPLWRPSESRSADNSPIHRPQGQSGMGITKPKKKPPPPPPRRSSMPVSGPKKAVSADSVQCGSTSPRLGKVLMSNRGDSARLTPGSEAALHAVSEPTITNAISVQDTTETCKSSSAGELKAGDSHTDSSTTDCDRRSTGSLDRSLKVHESDEFSQAKHDPSRSSSDSAVNVAKSKLRSYCSPSFGRKQISFDFTRRSLEERNSESDGGSDSDCGSRVKTLAGKFTSMGSSVTQPPPSSPQRSPLFQKRTSLDSVRPISPMRSLLRGVPERLSSGSDSGPPSPLRGPTSRSSLTLTRAALRPAGSGSTPGKDSSRKPLPFRMSRTRMSTSSSDSDASPTPLRRQRSSSADADSESSGHQVDVNEYTPKLEDKKSTENGTFFQKLGDPSRIVKFSGYKSKLDGCPSRPVQSTVQGGSETVISEEPDKPKHFELTEKSSGDSTINKETASEDTISISSLTNSGSDSAPTEESKEKQDQPNQGPAVCQRVDEIVKKTYISEDSFNLVHEDVGTLVHATEVTIESFKVDPNAREKDFSVSKDALVTEARQFVTDSKLLVSSATQSKEKLIVNMNNSIHTLAKIVQCFQVAAVTMDSPLEVQTLGWKIRDVACAYRTTVCAARVAAGRPLSDPNMKLLMRQATTLAAILSALMRTLKALDIS